MKKIGNGLRWFFAVLFVLASFGLFSESVVAGCLMMLLGVTLCPLIWKLFEKSYSPKLWMKIVTPIVLFVITAFAMPSSAIGQVQEPQTAHTQIEKQDNLIETEVNETVIAMSEATQVIPSDTITELTVHFINVGQGDATLITCGDHSMLIDAGDNNKGTTVQNYLQKQGIKKLDYLIGTHPDSDHIGGLDVIITKFDCGKIIMPDYTKDTATYRDVIDAMKYKGYKNILPIVGTSYQLGDAEFTLIAPNNKYSDPNNNSVGLILKHGDKKFLFTGDAEEEAEADIVANGIDISCDVYQVGHHGSNTSSFIALLDTSKPEFTVISCGEGNSYGHPRAETLNNFRSRGIKVYRTDEQGTIIAKSDGHTITFDESPSTTWIAGEPTKSGSTETTVQETEVNTQAAQTVGTTYVLNTSSKKFHRVSCGSLPTKNRKDTEMSRDEIIAKGYSPCKKCNP